LISLFRLRRHAEEPPVLPARIPNLLIQWLRRHRRRHGDNIPPHNLCEVVDALLALIENPPSTRGAHETVRGQAPTSPFAGFIHGNAPIREAYTTGKGILQLPCPCRHETDKRSGRVSIIVKEIP